MTMTIERHVDVQAGVGDAYTSWWRSFESGEISEDVELVEPTGPQRYRWRASVAGVGEEWIAEVTERIPGRRIAWTSRAGTPNAGCVTFHRLDDENTRVMLQLEYQPEGVARDDRRLVRRRRPPGRQRPERVQGEPRIGPGRRPGRRSAGRGGHLAWPAVPERPPATAPTRGAVGSRRPPPRPAAALPCTFLIPRYVDPFAVGAPTATRARSRRTWTRRARTSSSRRRAS